MNKTLNSAAYGLGFFTKRQNKKNWNMWANSNHLESIFNQDIDVIPTYFTSFLRQKREKRKNSKNENYLNLDTGYWIVRCLNKKLTWKIPNVKDYGSRLPAWKKEVWTNHGESRVAGSGGVPAGSGRAGRLRRRAAVVNYDAKRLEPGRTNLLTDK